MATVQPSYYELLGVRSDASETEIKTAFRQSALRQHPDQGGNPAVYRMIEIAYETLIDPDRRAAYDAGEYDDDEDPLMYTPPSGTYMNREPRGDDAYYYDDEPTAQWNSGVFTNGAPSYGDATAYNNVQVRNPRNPHHWYNQINWKLVLLAIPGVWLLSALFTGSIAIGPDDFASAALFGLFFWFMGSFTLRFLGWILVLWGLFAAYLNDAGAEVTALRVGFGIALWLCGQWFFTFRHGMWRSVVACAILTRLPWRLRPDRHQI